RKLYREGKRITSVFGPEIATLSTLFRSVASIGPTWEHTRDQTWDSDSAVSGSWAVEGGCSPATAFFFAASSVSRVAGRAGRGPATSWGGGGAACGLLSQWDTWASDTRSSSRPRRTRAISSRTRSWPLVLRRALVVTSTSSPARTASSFSPP